MATADGIRLEGKAMEPGSVKANKAPTPAILVFFASIILTVTPVSGQHRVTAVEGNLIVIDAGSSAGIRADMTGQIMTTEVIAGDSRSLRIADFLVVSVDRDRSEAKLTKLGPGWRVEAEMVVVFDQTLTPEADLGVIIIRSNVAGDNVSIDGRRLGPTPQRVEVNPGHYDIRVEKEGYEAVDFKVSVAPSQEIVVSAAFELESDKPDLEVTFWESIKDSSEDGDFQAYLERWPNGVFAVIAENRLRSLRARAAQHPMLPTPVQRSRARQNLDTAPLIVVDPSTGLLWATADNGSDISYFQAVEYCSAKGRGWSVPTVDQLRTIFRAGGSNCAKNLGQKIELTACLHWSSDAAKGNKIEFFSFENGRSYEKPGNNASGMRVLCVRSAG